MKISPPAFPTWIESDSMAHGMTLRDYFAAIALPVSLSKFYKGEEIYSRNEVAEDAYLVADCMMKARDQ
jgi:hypothetical protein